MAGQPGRSGGARKGAGRPKGSKAKAAPAKSNRRAPTKRASAGKAAAAPATVQQPLDYLLSVVNDPKADPRVRVRAAVAAAQYVHTRRADGGKKDEQGRKAKQVGGGKFAPSAPPKLVVSNA